MIDPTHFTGVVVEAGKPWGTHGVVFTEKVLRSFVEQFHKLPKNSLIGGLDIPQDGVVRMGDASHVVETLELVDGKLTGTVRILDTPRGQVAKALLKGAEDRLRLSLMASGWWSNGIVDAATLNAVQLVPKKKLEDS